ncbi:molybdate ABC transporter substrate-binding protein [Pokkaliibacter plantistimulans]|uniref:Molybdate ABC transporter substrate-binding protein n=1 Tax=Proteobacteria bacterium 228 TaxID=2083153 RepID=A0A2S5KU79_9PROT|nr:molybdate ABC transporter substrate-binding protein [Pokkaliibacter plantistimulans]PPC78298.1 molybdate ABC transporter substrate-binding protein [Pokkaliibacter plantistimulans]
MNRPVSALLLTLTTFAAAAHADQANIAVAANFTGVMQTLEQKFEARGQHQLEVSYGSTGKLYTQISNGAPFDVFLAADNERPAKAEQDGLAVKGSQFTYAQGQLALWSLQPFSSDDLATALQADYAHLAIGNPKTAPYGLAAQQTLQHLHLWDSLQPRLVQGDNISQTYQFIATGNAEMGFVALSQVKDGKQAGHFIAIPGSDYQPILQDAVLLSHGASNQAAKDFIDYLKSDEAKAIIREAGYELN